MNEVVPIAEARPNIAAGGRVAAIVPQSMDEAYRLAKAVCLAGMAPKGMDRPESCMIAIMHGMEIGLTPLTALQRIAVVNGRPTIWGDGAMSLVRGSGACEWIKESIAGDGEKMIATCEAKRRGEPTSISRTFSVADAKQAGLWGKSGPWTQYAKRMLQMRARAFCLRDGFADVLGGLYLREEIEEEHGTRPTPPTPPTVERSQTVAALAAPVPPKPPLPPIPPRPAAPVEEPFDPEALRMRFETAAKAATDIDALNNAWDQIVRSHEADIFPPDLEDLVGLFRRRENELEP